MGVHEAAHDDEAEDDLTDNKNVVDAIHGYLVRVLHLLDKWHNAERNDEEYREYNECD